MKDILEFYIHFNVKDILEFYIHFNVKDILEFYIHFNVKDILEFYIHWTESIHYSVYKTALHILPYWACENKWHCLCCPTITHIRHQFCFDTVPE